MQLYRTALQNLEAARRLIYKHWTRRTFAVDCHGKNCSPRSPKAVSFCALGAVRNVNGPGEIAATKILRIAARQELVAQGKSSTGSGNELIFKVNDDIGKEAVLSMFGRAIRLARKKK